MTIARRNLLQRHNQLAIPPESPTLLPQSQLRRPSRRRVLPQATTLLLALQHPRACLHQRLLSHRLLRPMLLHQPSQQRSPRPVVGLCGTALAAQLSHGSWMAMPSGWSVRTSTGE